jgi:hypothetical protein
VKSINLDKWPPGVLELYKQISKIAFLNKILDNKIANEFFEAKLKKDDEFFVKLQNDESLLQQHIRNKYDFLKWTPSGVTNPMALLYKGIDISGMKFK